MLDYQELANSTYLNTNSKNFSSIASTVFVITLKCKQGFSAMMSVKTRSGNRFTFPTHNSRCALSAVGLPLKQPVLEKQIKPSH